MARDLSAYLQDALEACTAIEDVMSGISLIFLYLNKILSIEEAGQGDLVERTKHTWARFSER